MTKEELTFLIDLDKALTKIHNVLYKKIRQLQKLENTGNKDTSSTKEIIYGCGHKSSVVILDCNELSVSVYLEWKDSVGFEGDKSQCWDCYCRSSTKNEHNAETIQKDSDSYRSDDIKCKLCKKLKSEHIPCTTNDAVFWCYDNKKEPKKWAYQFTPYDRLLNQSVPKKTKAIEEYEEKTKEELSKEIHSQNKDLLDRDYAKTTKEVGVKG